MKEVITIRDKQFELFIEQDVIEQGIKRIAEQMNSDLAGKNPIFLAVLNGAFMFAGELMKEVSVPSEITFVRLASYHGTTTTNKVQDRVQVAKFLLADAKGRADPFGEDLQREQHQRDREEHKHGKS